MDDDLLIGWISRCVEPYLLDRLAALISSPVSATGRGDPMPVTDLLEGNVRNAEFRSNLCHRLRPDEFVHGASCQLIRRHCTCSFGSGESVNSGLIGDAVQRWHRPALVMNGAGQRIRAERSVWFLHAFWFSVL